MKYAIPEMSWHNRDPVLSVDFQPKRGPNDPIRLASGGTDSHVLIWHFSLSDSGSVNFEVAADLTRHQKAVNVVRWAPSGELLASGDDEAIIFIWKLNGEKEPASTSMEQGDEVYKESWTIFKTLRGHMEDVLDISWSPNSTHLASGSVDNKLIVWDVMRGKYTSILTDHKGFVQGVAWDPMNQLIATASSDRVFRTFDVSTKKVVSRSSKAVLRVPPSHALHGLRLRLYHDDTLQTYFRRLAFSPDGLLVAVPGGRPEPEGGKVDAEGGKQDTEGGKMPSKPINAVYIYTRHCLKVPAIVLPTLSPPLAARWAPPRGPRPAGPPPRGPRPAGPPPLPLPRAVLAVATRAAVLLYDTQQTTPIAILSNIHYTRLTDLSWAPGGAALLAASTDGFCSVLTFAPGDLGPALPETRTTEPMEVQEDAQTDTPTPKTETKPEPKTKEEKPINRIDSFIKFKAPEKSPKKKQKVDQKKDKTPVKLDVLEEVAMPSWSDNSSSEIIKPKDCFATIEIEDSEDIKLVYEETEPNKSSDSQDRTPEPKDKKEIVADKESPKNSAEKRSSPPEGSFFKKAKVTDATGGAGAAGAGGAAGARAPRRVSFVTLSSPKNSKKKC